MGYMLRYHAAFRQIESWARGGLLGDLYAVRGHMSSFFPDATRGRQRYPGGIAFSLASHMIDPTLSLFGSRPLRVTSFLRNDATPAVPEYADNTLVVLEFERGMATIDIAAMEAPPQARRFEVYGTRGSAIVLEPFEPGPTVRLCLVEPGEGFQKGEQRVELRPLPAPGGLRPRAERLRRDPHRAPGARSHPRPRAAGGGNPAPGGGHHRPLTPSAPGGPPGLRAR